MRVALVGVLAAAAEAFVVPPPGRRLAVRDAAPATDEEKVAVLLSLNARGVSWRAVEAARACVPSADVFPTASLEEARVAAEEIVRRGYGTVVSAGGDGTLSAAVSMISEARAGWGEADPLLHMPRFVALPLGTGNAVARYVLGPRYRRWRGPRGVRRALDVLSSSGGGAKNVTNDLRVPVLRVDDGDLCFIAGCGFDSFILDDYQRLRAAVRNVPVVRNVLSSVFGYFVATAIATLYVLRLSFLRGRCLTKTHPQAPVCRGQSTYVRPRIGRRRSDLRRSETRRRRPADPPSTARRGTDDPPLRRHRHHRGTSLRLLVLFSERKGIKQPGCPFLCTLSITRSINHSRRPPARRPSTGEACASSPSRAPPPVPTG
mmetsp:Transcript_27262/g.88080  ORF Transcript_27262/g.88080 Transcript_27262/m.88080 type:complete len:375 (-) Transcript_27262:405-1529(-)